jgi:4-methyl-5(b-hydroxyethyl)-thiazole monophosphate biosynthesis
MSKPKAAVFLADGFEEIEAVTLIDILRRSEFQTQTVSVMSGKDVTGAHDIIVRADRLFDDMDKDFDILILPGGRDGTANLKNHKGTGEMLKQYNASKKWIAAVCAAPLVLESLGILEGKEAVCHPSCEQNLKSAKLKQDNVCVSENVITSRGAGTTAEFAFRIVELLKDSDTARALKNIMLY